MGTSSDDLISGEPEPRSRRARSGDPRLPAVVAVVAAIALYVTLPERFTVGAGWLLPLLEALLLVVLLLASPYREERHASVKAAAMAAIGLINAANIASLALLTRSLLAGTAGTSHAGVSIFFSAVQIWLTNVIVFALWFWELDRGGPVARALGGTHPPDFLFPQMTQGGLAPPGWVPGFVDYAYVSFTNATAFSPTDTMPLSPWAKVLMAVESVVSLMTVAVVAARAVNIL